jgi:hypothetical protein
VFAIVGAAGATGLVFALVNASKEKFGMALVGLIVPPVGAAAAFRLGKPDSLFARTYGKRRMDRARARFKGSRGEPFWRRGPELASRLGLARGGPRSRGGA